MSFKSQKNLFISAFVIVGLTVASIFALNYTVEKISEVTPPPYAMSEPVPPSKNMRGTDDAFNRGEPNEPKMPMDRAHEQMMPPEHMRKGQDRMMPPNMGMGRPPEMPDGPPKDAFRRVRGGKDAPDLKRARGAPPPAAKDDAAGNQKREPPRPTDMRDRNTSPPPFPDGRNLDPAEREMMEKELERRREMFFDSPNGPPPGYYPPPGYDRPDYDYGGGQEDSYDYDYDPDIEGKREDPEQETRKTTEVLENPHTDSEDGPDIVDEYIYEYFEE